MNKLKCTVGALVVLVLGTVALAGFFVFIVEPINLYLMNNHYGLMVTISGVFLAVMVVFVVSFVWYFLYDKCMNYHKRGEK